MKFIVSILWISWSRKGSNSNYHYYHAYLNNSHGGKVYFHDGMVINWVWVLIRIEAQIQGSSSTVQYFI